MIAVSVTLALALLLGLPGADVAQAAAKIPRIGLLSIGIDPSQPQRATWSAFFESLHALGYVESQSILIERRFAAGNVENPATTKSLGITFPPLLLARADEVVQ